MLPSTLSPHCLLWWFLQQRLGGLKRDAVDEGGCRVQLGRSSRRRAMHPGEAPDVDTVGAESYLQANPCQLQERSWRSMESAIIDNATDGGVIGIQCYCC